jgi:hypothetical protein
MLRAALEELRAMDASRMSPVAQTARLDAIRRSAESLGKLEPPARAEVMTVADLEKIVVGKNGATFGDLIGAWFRALEPWPMARAAMVEATDQTLGEAPMTSVAPDRATIVRHTGEAR